MCGISGIIDTQASFEKAQKLSFIQKMNDTIKHRGPDGEGVWISDNEKVVLGHRRLSILDLSDLGSQPMFGFGSALVFNGEIYNFIEIKKELQDLEYQFHSTSDTEVLLAAYRQWGEVCVERFNGMWAFILYDMEANKVFISRDRFGKKPVNIYEKNGCYFIGSEVKQFTVLPSWQAKANLARCYEFVEFGWQHHTAETFFEGVIELRGGHNLLIDLNNNSKTIHKYYDILKYEHKKDFSIAKAKEKLITLVKDAVGLRFRADVEVATSLSGGIDSSCVTVVANEYVKQQNSYPLQGFSSCFDAQKYKEWDEQEYIDSISNKINLKTHKIFTTDTDFWDNMDDMVWHHDSPFISAGMFAQYSLFRLIKANNIKVVLDGQGVDEAIGGYSGYNILYLRSLLKDKNWRFIPELLGYIYHNFTDFKTLFKKHQSIGNVIKTSIRASVESSLYRNVAAKTITDSCKEQLTSLFLPAYLHHQDRNSMAFSVESRAPFLDYRVVEFFLQIPDRQKIFLGKRKFILREAFKSLLSTEVYSRYKKLGFPAPLQKWMQDEPDRYRQELVKCLEIGLFDENIMERFDAQQQLGFPDYLKFWRIIAITRWAKKFNVVFPNA